MSAPDTTGRSGVLAPDPLSIFGRIVSAYDVEGWVMALLRRWSGTYLSEVERQHGYQAGALSRLRGWSYGPTFDKWPEDQVPGVLVVSPGLVPPPAKGGDGRYRARWRVDLGVICSARTQALSHEQAQDYIAAFRALLIQRPSLDGHADGTAWLDENYTPLSYDDTRSLYAGYATIVVDVDNVTTANAGPTTPDDPNEPDTDPWAPWPLVVTHDETVEHFPPPTPLPKEEP